MRKTRIGQTANNQPPIHFFLIFFLKILETWKQHKKHNISKKIIRAGAWPTNPLPSFSRIFGFS